MKSRKMMFCFWLLIFFNSTFTALAQKITKTPVQEFSCYQKKSERLKLIKEADSNPFRVHRIAFWGNIDTRDKTLRSDSIMNEGDIFSQSQLMKYIKNINEIKIINPTQIKNVKILLDRKSRDIDLVFCVTERKGK